MDDIVDLLERTTPAVSAPNVRELTRRARTRRTRRHAYLALPLIALLASAVALRPGPGHRVTAGNAGQPLGTWRRTSSPPIDVTAQVRTVTLADGRVVVVDGSFDVDMGVRRFESALYDANTDRWIRLADAPVTPRAGGADLLSGNHRIVLVTHDDADDVAAAMLDERSLQWRSIPLPPHAGHVFDGWAWDGATLVLYRAGLGPYGASTGGPLVERWSAATDTWHAGAAPPITARFLSTVAGSAHRLAVWGGYTFDLRAPGTVAMPTTPGAPVPVDAPHTGPRRAFTDGAIYDIGRDSWTYLPAESSLAEMANRSAEGLVSDSTFTLLSSQIDGVPRIAVRYERGHWHTIPSPSGSGGMGVQRETGTISIPFVSQSGPQRAQYIDAFATQWRAVPAYDLARGSHGLLATSATMDNPGRSAFSVWQLDGTTWTRAASAPFENRMEPGIAVTGDRLLVIGGQQGPNLEPRQDAWILDLTDAR